ncbi:MAG TPA: PadR family transcriptional regulator [Vicinamibacterales bacterium]|jgi:PadR family transcriptional regulator PadR|nr:PadR family transcriptional regulator [Vicinamibacterales bacterium]
MGRSTDVWLGTLSVMVLTTLDTMGPLHGYGIGRRIEQTSGGRLVVNYGTLYPCLLKLEEDGFVSSAWGVSENGRRARFYAITRAGRRHLAHEAEQWARTTEILARFLAPRAEA